MAADERTGTEAERQVVLVVDDEADIIRSVSLFLNGAMPDVEVLTAENGEDALALIKDHPVDVVVSDQRMPGMEGTALLKEARRLRPNVGRVLMTAFADLDLAMRAINELQLDAFLSKPLEPPQLLGVVKRTLQNHRTERLRRDAMTRALKARPRGEAEGVEPTGPDDVADEGS